MMLFFRSNSRCVCERVLKLLADFQCVFIVGAATVTGAHQGGGQTDGLAMAFVVYITMNLRRTGNPSAFRAAQLGGES